MANTFITPSTLAPRALATLYEQMAMMPLVWTDLSSAFGPQKVGNTVNIVKPATFVAQEFDRATGIVVQDATETTIPVVLNHLADVSFSITSEQATMSLDNIETQLIAPAMEAIAQKIDKAILALKADVTQTAGTTTGKLWNMPEVLIEAGRLLNIQKVPLSDRAAVIGPTTHAEWLNADILKQYDKSGSTEALRNGSIGRNLFGFDAYWTQNIPQPVTTSGQPSTEVGLAFHKSAFAFASAPLETPPGSNAEVRSYKGINIRIVSQYDIIYKKTVFSLDTLYGVKTIDANRAVLLKGANNV
jgi:hypothetical protein